MRRRRLSEHPIWAAAAFVAVVARPAGAVDPFEIQVYDGTANHAGEPGLELHVNRVLVRARRAQASDLLTSHLTTFTLEPSFGVFDFWELGGYFQTALRADGELDYAGVKLRSKFVTSPSWSRHLRLGANFEFSIVPRSYESGRYGGEIRPIAAWEDESWLLAVNPILSFAFTGADSNLGPAFEPCVLAKRKFGPFALGVEYYAGLGPISEPLPWAGQDQYLYETFDWIAWSRVEMDFGLGEGLNRTSNELVAKINVGYVWESIQLAPAAAPKIARASDP